MQHQLDRSGVVVLPPLMMGLALLSVIALHWLWPMPISEQAVALTLGIVLAIFGIAIMAWGRITMVGAGTNVSPFKPILAIVTGGPFRFTRNPLYVGVTSLFVGLSLIIDTWWGFVVLVPVALTLHLSVSLPILALNIRCSRGRWLC